MYRPGHSPPGDEAAAVQPTLDFLDLVFPRPRAFDFRLWTGQTIPAGNGPSRFTLTLTRPGSLRRMLSAPLELSLGEAYLRGDFEIEGDLVAAFALPHTVREIASSPTSLRALISGWLRLPRGDVAPQNDTHAPAHLHGPEHSPGRDRAAIQYHYDVGNDFYRLFLDKRMVYSCAYFTRPDLDLDAAQEAKLEHICRKLRLRPGDRLLDVGCGWGGLLIYAAERHGVEGVGLTLSEEQYALARERVAQAGLGDRIRIELKDYRDLDEQPFDRIVSVGMFEHVGRDRFDEYFSTVFRLLRPSGLFLNHAIASRAESSGGRSPVSEALDRYLVGREGFRKRYIFPDGELDPISRANLSAEQAGFEVRDVENLREHYALTLRHWMDRLRERREEAVRMAGEPLFRLWEMYLAGSIYHFDSARLNINQSLMVRLDDGEAGLPLTREEVYRPHPEGHGLRHETTARVPPARDIVPSPPLEF